MVYASPVPAEFVSGDFYGQQTFYLSADKLEGDFSPVRFRRELKIFRKFCKQGAVLDVGCSTGAFLWQMGQRFPRDYHLLGTDVAGNPMDHAKAKGVPIAREAFLEMEECGKLDAVCFWAVLEHLANPGQFLKKAAALLRPAGHCFVLVPNLHSLAVRLLGPRYRYIMPEHLNYFERRTLAQLLGRTNGLEAIAWGTSHFNPAVIWRDWREPREGRVPDEERARLLRRTNAMKASVWLGPLRPVYAAVEGVLSAAGLADNLWLVARRK
jgi:SAM-dependent methyltransferase